MKKNLSLLIIVVLLSIFALSGFSCSANNLNNRPMLRFHIRAHSNSSNDQEIKLTVRDAVLNHLEPRLKNAQSIPAAVTILERESNSIVALSNRVLAQHGFNYLASIRIGTEFFPSRMYGDIVIQSGYFKAVIIELGNGAGDNWWCVLYPPLCYLEARGEFRYRSLLVDLISGWFA